MRFEESNGQKWNVLPSANLLRSTTNKLTKLPIYRVVRILELIHVNRYGIEIRLRFDLEDTFNKRVIFNGGIQILSLILKAILNAMRYFIPALLLFVLVSCGKDKFNTVPTLKYETVNTRVLGNGQVIRFTLSFTDKEGDVQDSIFVQKVPLNCAASTFTEVLPIPVFPTQANQKGEIEVSYGYNVPNFPFIQVPQCPRNDTCFFRFMLKDKAQNRSDTVNSDIIVILR